jgi:glycerol kinase
MEIWENTREVIAGALRKAGIAGADLAALGITNQRETVVVWDRRTGRPYSNAIVWQCARTRDICEELIKDGGPDRFRAKTGLPVATYFSVPRSSGFWTTSPRPDGPPRPARPCSGPWSPGSSGG